MFRLGILLIVLTALVCSQFAVRNLLCPGKELAAAFSLEQDSEKNKSDDSEKDFKSETGKLALGILIPSIRVPLYVLSWSHGFWQEEELQSITVRIGVEHFFTKALAYYAEAAWLRTVHHLQPVDLVSTNPVVTAGVLDTGLQANF